MTVNKSPFMYLCSYLIPGGSGFEPAGIFLGGLSLVLGTLVILNCSLFCVFLYVSHNFVFCVLSLDIHGVERVSVTITVKSKFKRKCCYTWTSVNALLSHLRLLTLHLCHSTAQNRKYTILYEPHLWACSACSLLSVTNSLPLHSLALVWTYPNFPASSSSCCWGNKQRHRTVYSISDWGSGKNWLHARCQKAYTKVKRKKTRF